jgi:hypothetical protein
MRLRLPAGRDPLGLRGMIPGVAFQRKAHAKVESGYAASEVGAPFVARRAVNLHGWKPASLCPPFFLLRGYPGSAELVPGRPPSCGDSAGG